jgi:periplasmic protein TonB
MTGKPAFGSGAVSFIVHAAVLALLAFGVVRSATVSVTPPTSRITFVHLVYTPDPGNSGSRPSGGEKSVQPARSAQVMAARPVIAPAARPMRTDNFTPQATVPDPPPAIAAPTAPLVEAGLRDAVGTLAEVRLGLDSRGPGDGAGINGGQGPGGGKGGRGPGENTGDEDGVSPGNGVSWPRLVQEVKPNYTADAMRAQLQGLVELEIVVLPDGSVGRISIVRSLDSRFGLDAEAIKAVRLWRFDPARRAGKAIAARVGVELSFNLR